MDSTELDDFSDLDEIISDAEARRASAKAVAGKQKRLAKGGISEDEKFAILAEIRAYEDQHIWQTVAAVALFDTQICETCGATHRFFQGWMTAQQHKRDPNCRRLTRGKPIDHALPARIEEHQHGKVEMCGNCAESCLAIDAAVAASRAANVPLSAGKSLEVRGTWLLPPRSSV